MSAHANGPAGNGAVTENQMGTGVSETIVDRNADNGSQGTLLGVDLAIENRDEFWWATAMRALRWLADAPGTFESYDLTELGVPDPDHPNRWGALFRAAHTAGTIRPAGYTQSRRPGRAGGLCRVWTGGAR